MLDVSTGYNSRGDVVIAAEPKRPKQKALAWFGNETSGDVDYPDASMPIRMIRTFFQTATWLMMVGLLGNLAAIAQQNGGAYRPNRGSQKSAFPGATKDRLQKYSGGNLPKDAVTRYSDVISKSEKGGGFKDARGGSVFSAINTDNRYYYYYPGKFDSAGAMRSDGQNRILLDVNSDAAVRDLLPNPQSISADRQETAVPLYAAGEDYFSWPDGHQSDAQTAVTAPANGAAGGIAGSSGSFSVPLTAPSGEPLLELARMSIQATIPAAGQAAEFQAQAEQSFREGRYEEAARWSAQAVGNDFQNGRLHLFASQILFTLGDYRSAAAAVHQAASFLSRDQWGYVLERYKQFYRGDDYVKQMEALSDFIRRNPDAAYAYFLRGYHYKFLGQNDAAAGQLQKVVELEKRDLLAAELLRMCRSADKSARE